MVFPGLYNGRNEPENLSWDAGFRVNKANNVTMIGNVVAGKQFSCLTHLVAFVSLHFRKCRCMTGV